MVVRWRSPARLAPAPAHPRRRLAWRGGAADDTLTYLVMSDDAGDGRLRLDGDSVRVDWAGAGDRPVFDRNAEVLQKMSASLGARFVGNPLSTPMFNDSLVTVHPLGGARWPTTAPPASWTTPAGCSRA